MPPIRIKVGIRQKIIREATVELEVDENMSHRDAETLARDEAERQQLWRTVDIETPWMSTTIEKV